MSHHDPDTSTPSATGGFISFLTSKRDGVTGARFDAELAKAVITARQMGLPVTLTYTVKIEPMGPRKMKITDDLRTKEPTLAPESSYFFAADDGTLLRRDPSQPELTLVTEPTAATAPVITPAPAPLRSVR